MATPAPMAAVGERTLIGKVLRYSAASVAGTIVGEGTLILCSAGFGWSGVVSNLVSVSLGSIPNYLLNRYWTWQKAGRDRMATEVVVFWVMALLGLILSTFFVAYADHRWGTTLAIAIAQAVGFGVLWVAKFLFLDKVLFKTVERIEAEHATAT
jgi:putative flippase GtrA